MYVCLYCEWYNYQSFFVTKELHRQEEGDQPEDNAANQNQGNPQDTNNQQQLPGGEAAVQGGLNDPNVANQQFVNVANGEEGNAAGGEGQQAAQNIYGQSQGGLPETGQNQEEPNPNKLEQGEIITSITLLPCIAGL